MLSHTSLLVAKCHYSVGHAIPEGQVDGWAVALSCNARGQVEGVGRWPRGGAGGGQGRWVTSPP